MDGERDEAGLYAKERKTQLYSIELVEENTFAFQR